MTLEEKQNNPRATVEKVYEQIIKDLNQAIDLLEGYDNGTNKDKIDGKQLHTVYEHVLIY